MTNTTRYRKVRNSPTTLWSRSRIGTTTGVLTLVLLLAACSGDDTSSPNTTAIPDNPGATSTTATTTSASTSGTTTSEPAIDRIPDGRYSRVATVEEGAAHGLDVELISAVAGADGELPTTFVFEGDQWKVLNTNDAGVEEVGDLGTTAYQDGQLLLTNNHGKTLVYDWSIDGDRLTLTLMPGADDDEIFVTDGEFTRDADSDAVGETADSLTLTFANPLDDLPEQIIAYAVAVDELSGGALTFDFRNDSGSEDNTIKAVRGGRVAVGWVGARAFPEFDALLAPLLVDSYELQRAVFDAGIPAHMAAGLDDTGLTALAVLPGPMRKILGVNHPLLAPADFEGAVIAGDASPLAEATVRALGASPTPGFSGQGLTGLDGVMAQLTAIGGNGYQNDADSVVTNLNLWPRPLVIIMTTETYASLTSDQQAILTTAGAEAIERADTASRQEDVLARPSLCDSPLELLTATNEQLAELRDLLEPVFAELRKDPANRALLDQIEELKRRIAAPSATLTC
jgi:TRAP-type C4-dicarboxylate transport system substrate-binding protein